MLKEMCDLVTIVKTRTTQYRPSANGQVEHINRTILQVLRCFIRGKYIDLMLHPGGEEDGGTPVTYAARHQEATRTAHLEARQKLQQSQRRQKSDYDMCLEGKKYSVCDAVYRVYRSVVMGQSFKNTAHLVGSLDCDTGNFLKSVFYRIANCKRSVVAHHDSLKLYSDRDLPIWLLRKRHELRGTLGEYVSDRVLEQATDALR